MALLVLLNNFLHDFSAAGWIFLTVLLWLFLRKKDKTAENSRIIVEMLKPHLLLMQINLIGIILFGSIRAYAYKKYEWNSAAGESQITLLIVKHVLFFGTVVWGFVCYAKAKKVLKEKQNDRSQ